MSRPTRIDPEELAQLTDCLREIAECPARYTGGQSLAGYADGDAEEAADQIVRRLFRGGGEPDGLHAAIVAAIEADVAELAERTERAQ